jgi:uncharacterized membrane protein YedE/YeeE
MNRILPFAAGLLFGLGLIVSGMSDPDRILGFLDFAGPNWNPALALVMVGGLAVTTPAFYLARRRGKTLAGMTLSLPDRKTITPRLVIGSVLFGVGWGLSGVCPGPSIILAVTGLAGGLWPPLLFFAGLLAGMAAFSLWSRRQAAAPPPAAVAAGER